MVAGIGDILVGAKNAKDFLKTIGVTGTIANVSEMMMDYVVSLTEAGSEIEEAPHVDGGAHKGLW